MKRTERTIRREKTQLTITQNMPVICVKLVMPVGDWGSGPAGNVDGTEVSNPNTIVGAKLISVRTRMEIPPTPEIKPANFEILFFIFNFCIRMPFRPRRIRLWRKRMAHPNTLYFQRPFIAHEWRLTNAPTRINNNWLKYSIRVYLGNTLTALFENIAKFEYLVMLSDSEASLMPAKLRFFTKFRMTLLGFRTAPILFDKIRIVEQIV